MVSFGQPVLTLWVLSLVWIPNGSVALSCKSSFCGAPIQHAVYHPSSSLEMRKQKASDRRTRRLQRGDILTPDAFATTGSLTSSPMSGKNWKLKQTNDGLQPQPTGGRGRSRKRSALYNSLSLYHNKFLKLLTEEYKQEVRFNSFIYFGNSQIINYCL
jgi:hypothetical protein